MGALRSLLQDAAGDWRSRRRALRVGGRDYTYAELADRVEAAAAVLTERGIGAGDVVAQMAPNCLDLVVNLFAVLRVGGVYCPLSPAFTAVEAAYRLGHSGARAVLCDEAHRTAAGGSAAPAWSCDLSAEGWGRPRAPLPPDDPRRPALLLYTSGSTGRPKGVLLSEANLLANAAQVAARTGLTADDRILHVMPLHHTNGINNNLIAPMMRGVEVVLTEGFRAETFFRTVAAERPTYFTGVPTMYWRLLQQPLVPGCMRGVRFVRCGSAPLRPELEAEIETRLGVPVVTSYGLTEGTCTSTMTPPGASVRGSVGPALDGQEVAVVDPESGRDLPPGEVGEVVVRGPNVMRGYLDDAEATAAAVRGGRLHTGDLGLLDARGHLFLRDRLKDVIIRGGENVSPKEVEEALLTHPSVREAAVVGVPSAEFGEEPWAFVVVSDATPPEALQANARERLARFKVPRRILPLDDLPRNALGKIERSRLRELALGAADRT